MEKILLIHGPNLNLLGKRNIDIYGDFTINPLIVYHSLGPDKKTRKKAKECIITNY